MAIGGDFSDTRGILNRKPRINFVEPEQVPEEQASAEIPVDSPLLDRKVALQDLISQYDRLEQLSDLAQKRIDVRAKNLKACLDSNKDADILSALRRKFGDVSPCITHQQYKVCLEEISRAGNTNVQQFIATETDLQNARSNKFKTDFGGYTTDNGTLRPEVQFDSPIQPINQEKFQSDMLKKLFEMMKPIFKKFVDKRIKELT